MAISMFRASDTHASCDNKMFLAYINGVFNSRDEAEETTKKLAEFAQTQNFLEGVNLRWNPEEFDLFYNYSFGVADLVEAYRQKEGELTDKYWDWMFNIAKAPPWFSDLFKKLARENVFKRKDSFDKLQDFNISELYHRLILLTDAKYTVLIVAHSQGNFFANAVYDELNGPWVEMAYGIEDAGIRIVSVATPASKVAGNGSHVTLQSDWLIRSIPSALPPNATNRIPEPGLFDHQFLKHYLNGDGASALIASSIKAAAISLSEVDKEPSELACTNWFQRNMPTGTTANKCESTCVALPLGMGNFNCTADCRALCRCYGPRG